MRVMKWSMAAVVAVSSSDSSTWPEWSPVVRYERERAGDANGVGEVRVFHNKP
jgi:hypothetical protein